MRWGRQQWPSIAIGVLCSLRRAWQGRGGELAEKQGCEAGKCNKHAIELQTYEMYMQTNTPYMHFMCRNMYYICRKICMNYGEKMQKYAWVGPGHQPLEKFHIFLHFPANESNSWNKGGNCQELPPDGERQARP